MKRPTPEESARCLEIRCRSKRGDHVCEEDSAFCRSMWKRYPEWYGKTEAHVYNRTVPFGSNVRKKEEIEP